MKKLAFSVLVIISALLVSCGGSSGKVEKENKEDIKEEGKSEIVVLDSEDAMMAKLAEYNITIPENMILRTVEQQVYLDENFEEKETYLVYFDSKDSENVNSDELLEWYNSQRDILKNSGWTEESNEEDLEIMGGGTYNKAVLVNESENCTLDMRLGISDEGYTISIHPKYEIK
jgi:hypothetical protein